MAQCNFRCLALVFLVLLTKCSFKVMDIFKVIVKMYMFLFPGSVGHLGNHLKKTVKTQNQSLT